MARACERSVSGAENGAERAKNRVSGSGAVSGLVKRKRSVSGARSGGFVDRERSGSGLNCPLKFRSSVKYLKFQIMFEPILTLKITCRFPF